MTDLPFGSVLNPACANKTIGEGFVDLIPHGDLTDLTAHDMMRSSDSQQRLQAQSFVADVPFDVLGPVAPPAGLHKAQAEPRAGLVLGACDNPQGAHFPPLSGVTGSIPTNLGYLNDMIMLPGGIYNWEKQQYYYLLADESSALSPDGLTFNYKVREGLKWSDGSPLTAKDVYNTFVMRYAMQQPVFNYIKDIELVDDSNVKFALNSPAPIAVYWIMRERPTASAQYSAVVEDAAALGGG